MTLIQLQNLISMHKVPSNWYSLDEGLKPDAYIIYKNYSKWEYFYLDERGERHDFQIFFIENEAYDYLWKKLKRQLEILNKSTDS